MWEQNTSVSHIIIANVYTLDYEIRKNNKLYAENSVKSEHGCQLVKTSEHV